MFQNLPDTEGRILFDTVQAAQLFHRSMVLLGNAGKGFARLHLMNRGTGLCLLGSNTLLLELPALFLLIQNAILFVLSCCQNATDCSARSAS